jgi:hypothetical protein
MIESIKRLFIADAVGYVLAVLIALGWAITWAG